MVNYLIKKFGISDENSDAFEVTFLGGLSSGIITGIFTGLIVGLVIFWVQKKHDERVTRKNCDREVSIFFENLLSKNRTATTDMLEPKGERSLPLNVLGTIDFITTDNPIPYWIDNVSWQYKYKLSSVHKFEKLYREFKEVSQNLDADVKLILLESHLERMSFEENLGLFYGVVNHYDRENIKRRLPYLLTDEELNMVEELGRDPLIIDSIKRYKSLRMRVLREYQEMIDLFEKEI